MTTIKTFALAALTLGLFIIAVMSYLDLPTVYMHAGSPIGCETADMTRPADIKDPRCKEVLRGRYDTREIGGRF